MRPRPRAVTLAIHAPLLRLLSSALVHGGTKGRRPVVARVKEVAMIRPSCAAAGPEGAGGDGLPRGTDHGGQAHGIEAQDGSYRKHLQSSWDDRVDSWSEQVEASAAFARVLVALLEHANPQRTDRCVDLGAGTGFLTLPLAVRVEHVVAVDVAPLMLNRLASRAAAAGLRNVHTKVDDMTRTDFPSSSLELVVSNYALHSVPHHDKLVLLDHVFKWLAPGGRIVIADMMLGHGGSGRDRRIAAAKIRRLAARGPAGWWRAARNAAQLSIGLGENRPASPAWWVGALQQAGFTQVIQTDVVAEAGVVAGVKPTGG